MAGAPAIGFGQARAAGRLDGGFERHVAFSRTQAGFSRKPPPPTSPLTSLVRHGAR
jgi:hypothetical protein